MVTATSWAHHKLVMMGTMGPERPPARKNPLPAHGMNPMEESLR